MTEAQAAENHGDECGLDLNFNECYYPCFHRLSLKGDVPFHCMLSYLSSLYAVTRF